MVSRVLGAAVKLPTWSGSVMELGDYPWWDRPRMLGRWAMGWVRAWVGGYR